MKSYQDRVRNEGAEPFQRTARAIDLEGPPVRQSRLAFITRLCLFSCFLPWAFAPAPTQAGNGHVNSDGTIDLTINFRFPITAAQVTAYRDEINAASHILWDASEGQLRFGNVTLTTGHVNEDQADVWAYIQFGRSASPLDALSTPGAHWNWFNPRSPGFDWGPGAVLAHEFGHLGLGLCDEYDEESLTGCWGHGVCIDPADASAQNQCLMQMRGLPGFTEFCTTAHHDPLRGDNVPCSTTMAPPGCTANCELFNATTGHYETTVQTQVRAVSCWAWLASKFSFLHAPVGLPVAAEPTGFVNPNIIDSTTTSDTVMLVLDRSGSMAWNTESDFGEVCGDGIDNDGDGSVDEADCTQARQAFVKAAARAWLALANNGGVKAGVVSFNDTGAYDVSFRDVTDANMPAFDTAINGLIAGGGTGIGTALTQTIFPFDAETGNKSILLITDGVNTAGPAPATVIPSMNSRGIRVFTVSTGGASDDSTLTTISTGTGATPIDSRSATTLVNAFAQQWARYRNITTVVPRQAYDTRSQTSSIPILVEPDKQRMSFILAGNLSDMSLFGVHAILNGPAGPGPSHFDTDVPDPNMRVVRDGFFMLIEIDNMNGGSWTLNINPAAGASPFQTGNLTILSDNPLVDLFTSLDRHLVTDTSVPVHLDIIPLYHTTLQNLAALTAQVVRPDGSTAPVPIETQAEDSGRNATYSARINDMPFTGMYEVRVTMRTGPGTWNDPGESLFDADPSNSLPIPLLERTSVEYFFVPHELASNDTPEEAIPLDLTNGCASVRGSIRPHGDVDYYKVVVPTGGAKLWANLDTGGPQAPGATSRDSVLTLYKDDGVSVVEADDDDGSGNGADSSLESGDASVLGGIGVPAGSYYLVVRAHDPRTVIDPYALTVCLTTEAPAGEIESNNTTDTANPLNTPLDYRRAAIDFAGDVDCYRIKLASSQMVTVITDGDPNRTGMGADLIVEWIAPDFQTVLFTADSSLSGSVTNPPAEGFRFAVANGGTYFIRIHHKNQAGTGPYELMVSAEGIGQFRFSQPAYDITEDGGSASIFVERVGGSFGTVTVGFATSNATATAGLDYTATAGTLTFNHGETFKKFEVPIKNDGIIEGNEFAFLTLSNPTGLATLGSPSMAVLNIFETGPNPLLKAAITNGNLVFSWPVWARGYLLESAHSLDASTNFWLPSSAKVSVLGSDNLVTLPLQFTNEFFRLRKP